MVNKAHSLETFPYKRSVICFLYNKGINKYEKFQLIIPEHCRLNLHGQHSAKIENVISPTRLQSNCRDTLLNDLGLLCNCFLPWFSTQQSCSLCSLTLYQVLFTLCSKVPTHCKVLLCSKLLCSKLLPSLRSSTYLKEPIIIKWSPSRKGRRVTDLSHPKCSFRPLIFHSALTAYDFLALERDYMVKVREDNVNGALRWYREVIFYAG